MATCADPIRLIPGPTGTPGANGTNGTNGINAYTTLSANFIMPAIGLTSVASVVESRWAVIGESVYLQGAGTLIVTAVVPNTSITLQNPSGYPLNVAGGTVIASGNKLGPGGLIGPSGSGGASGSGVTVSNKGDIQSRNATVPANLGVGANGTRPMADSAQAIGLRYDKVDLASSAEVKNQLPVSSGGTGAGTAAGAATNLAVLPLLGGTLIGQLTVAYGAPSTEWKDTSGALDQKRWVLSFGGGSMNFYVGSDDASIGNSWLIVSRNGAVPTLVDFQVPVRVSSTLKVLHFFDDLQNVNGTLVNGNNNNFGGFISSYTKIKNGPNAAFTITGITGGADGRMLLLHNATGQNMTLSHEDGLSIGSNRIVSLTGASVSTVGDGFAELIYDIDLQRWVIKYITA